MHRVAIACAALAAVVSASPAPAPQLDLAQLAAATPVPQGPADPAEYTETATLYTSVTITGVAVAQATGNQKRAYVDSSYTPYYPALATSYTTDPALAASKTTTAGQPCVTQPEAGTYCGFLNPLDPCAPQPDGYGPVPSPDTASAFLAFPKLHQSAKSAPTVVPSKDGNQYTQTFKDLNGAVSGSSYLGLYTLKQYSAADCAARCDATDLCTAFVSSSFIDIMSFVSPLTIFARTSSPSVILRLTPPTTTLPTTLATQPSGDRTAPTLHR
jgi:hypothetical protein